MFILLLGIVVWCFEFAEWGFDYCYWFILFNSVAKFCFGVLSLFLIINIYLIGVVTV